MQFFNLVSQIGSKLGYQVSTNLQEIFPDSYSFVKNENYQIYIWGRVYPIEANSNSCLSSEELLELFKSYGKELTSYLHGSFIIMLVDKKKDSLFIINDRVSTKSLYYYFNVDTLYVSTNYAQLVGILKQNNINLNISLSASYQLLSLGYMLGEHTIFSEIKKLRPASIISVAKKMEITNYFRYDNSPKLTNVEESLSLLDYDLTNAIKREFDWDNEHNKKHLITISGGLDSRIVYFLAKREAYNNNQLFTYAANKSLDEVISKQIAISNKEDFLLSNIDNCNHIFNWRESIDLNYGNVIYHGTTGFINVLKNLNPQRFGVIHTGGLGEGGFGGYLKNTSHTNLAINLFPKNSFINRIKDDFEEEYNLYHNDEMFTFYSRAINGMSNAFLIGNNFLETSSIFLDYHFLKNSLSIDPKLRYNRKIMEEYIIKFLPKSNQFITEKYGTTLDASSISKLFIRAKRSANYRLLKKTCSMNPYEYWFKTNESLRTFFKECFSDRNKYINDKNLLADIESIYSKSIYTKLNVASLIKTLEYYK